MHPVASSEATIPRNLSVSQVVLASEASYILGMPVVKSALPKLRQGLLRMHPHPYSDPCLPVTQGSPAGLRVAAAALIAGLNEEQRLAVQRVLGGADYSLVLGMPGTGKTSLIVATVQPSLCKVSCLLTRVAHEL